MTFGWWFDLVKVVAFLAAILLGTGTISSSCWVWVRKQVFGGGGGALCGFGVVLIGLSVWHSVSLKVSTGGISFDAKQAMEIIERLDKNIAAASGPAPYLESLTKVSAGLQTKAADLADYASTSHGWTDSFKNDTLAIKGLSDSVHSGVVQTSEAAIAEQKGLAAAKDDIAKLKNLIGAASQRAN
jgi:hypothetical protein